MWQKTNRKQTNKDENLLIWLYWTMEQLHRHGQYQHIYRSILSSLSIVSDINFFTIKTGKEKQILTVPQYNEQFDCFSANCLYHFFFI